MISPLTQSISSYLHEIETVLRAEDESSDESPEGNFARHVFESVDESGPVVAWRLAVSHDMLRRGMAPNLAAFGFRCASRRIFTDTASRMAWEAGLRRLSQREPFTPDRQTFAFRPVEMFGLSLGIARSNSPLDDFRQWLIGIYERLASAYTHDCWGRCLYDAGAQLLERPDLTFHPKPGPTDDTLPDLALQHWLKQAHPSSSAAELAADHDAKLLTRAILEPHAPIDLARASVLYQSIRQCVQSVVLGLNQRSREQGAADSMSSNRVFVVHGHDGEAKQATARFLERLGLEAIILHEQQDGGRTIIEKFEAYSDVGFAIIVHTADDVGNSKKAHDKDGTLKARSRQNVVFEHGYFFGRLGRGRVVALVRGDIDIPSDLQGVIYTPMDDHDAWKTKVAKEMKAAGLSIDMNKL